MKLENVEIALRSYGIVITENGKHSYKYNNDIAEKYKNCEVKYIHFENGTLWVFLKDDKGALI